MMYEKIPFTKAVPSTCFDFELVIPHDLLHEQPTGVHTSNRTNKRNTSTVIPVTRSVRVRPMRVSDDEWKILPTAEFMKVCEAEHVLAERGPKRVFRHYYKQKYPGRTEQEFATHDLHRTIARKIKRMYLTHTTEPPRRHITFSTKKGGKKCIRLDVLKKHLRAEESERKNKHKLAGLQGRYPSMYDGITLQSFTAQLWVIRNPYKSRTPRKWLRKRFKMSEVQQCLDILRGTKVQHFLDWWSDESAGVPHCSKVLWYRFQRYLAHAKLDTTPWSFRRFLYCIRRVCSAEARASTKKKCLGAQCDGNCLYAI